MDKIWEGLGKLLFGIGVGIAAVGYVLLSFLLAALPIAGTVIIVVWTLKWMGVL